MNVTSRWLLGILAYGLWSASVGPALAAAPSNPLRPTGQTLRDDAVRPAVGTSEGAAGTVQPVGYPSRAQPAGHQTASTGRTTQHATPGYVPRHLAAGGAVMYQESEVELPSASGMVDEVWGEPTVEDGGWDGDGCESCAGVGCDHCCLIPCSLFSLRNFEFFLGTQGFSGPANLGQTGSFGFNYGFNWGAPFPFFGDSVGMQAGFRGTQSNLSGSQFSEETRNQYFVTAGLFRRVDWGLQYGAVIDYVGNTWYHNADLTQLRGEISWMFPECHEIGFWVATETKRSQDASQVDIGDGPTTLTLDYGVTDRYAFFYRFQFDECGSYGRLFAGFSGDQHGLVGCDGQVPLTETLAMETNFFYLVPEQGRQDHAQEGWNLTVGLVWYPGWRTARSLDYNRPLFDVADNGWLMTTIRQ